MRKSAYSKKKGIYFYRIRKDPSKNTIHFKKSSKD